jgi:hypothetical protein
MPKKKAEPKGASTTRSRKFRTRQRFRKLLSAHDSFIALDLAAHYRSQGLAADVWIEAGRFFQRYATEHQKLLLTRQFSGVESTTVLIDGRTVRLIRPKSLGAETNGNCL